MSKKLYIKENEEEKQCRFCEYYLKENCPDAYFCYDKLNKPGFKLNHKYRSKFTTKDGKVFYNINHFYWFQKIIAKIFYKIKVEDI